MDIIALVSIMISVVWGGIVLYKFRHDLKFEKRDKTMQIRKQKLKSLLHHF